MKLSFCCGLLLCIVLQSATGALLGSSKCTWGPSFWCNSISHAKVCDAVDHCKNNYWNKPVKNDEVCELCKDGMKIVDGYLEQNGTEQEIENALLQICASIPLAQLSQDCKQAVTQDFNVIYDELLAILGNGEVVCSALHLCSSAASNEDGIDELVKRLPDLVKDALKNHELPVASPFLAPVPVVELKKTKLEVSDDHNCMDCTTFMTDLQGVAKNNNSIISDLTDLIKEQCDTLGPGISELCKDQVPTLVKNLLPQFESACEKAVDQVVPVIVDAIESNDVNLICSTILMCPSGSHNTPKAGDLCNDCVAFTNDWKAIIVNNQSIINDLITKAEALYCNQLPGFLQPECHSVFASTIEKYIKLVEQNCSTFVKDYLPQLWDLIDENDAETICETVYMCDDKKEEIKQEIAPAAKPIPIKSDEKVSDPVTCALCKVVVHEVDKLLEGNKTASEIISVLEKVCSLYSQDIRDECKRLIEKYGEEIIDMLIDEVESGVICNTLMLCATAPRVEKVSDDTACQLCETVMTFLDQELTSNSTEEEITKAVEQVCTLLPSSDQAVCRIFIDQYGPQVIDELAHAADPKTICTALNLCTKAKTIEVKSSTTCDLCQDIAKELDKFITENSTETEIIAAVEKVCGMLPSSLKTECDALIDMYGPQIIDMLAKKLDPKDLCTALKLCSAVKSSTTCGLCEDIAKELDKFITENSTETEIIAAVEKVCGMLPSSLKTECDALIDMYGPQIIDMLAKKLDPKDLCTALKLCSAKLQLSDSCELCTLIAQELEHLLDSQSTEEEIINAVEKVCTLLPSNDQAECKTLIEQYGATFIELLTNLVTPEKLCSVIKLCSSELIVSRQMLKSSTGCQICTTIMGALDAVLDAKSTEEEITRAVQEVCSLLPTKDQAECNKLITQYGDMIIRLLVNLANPKEVCSLLGLCPKQVRKVPVKSDEACALCTLVATELDSMLKENATQTEIIAALDKVCKVLPSTLSSQCVDFIDSNGVAILDLLANQLSPLKICSALGICPKAQKTVAAADGVLCDVCHEVIKFLDQELSSNATKEEIEAALETVCQKLPKQFQEACDDLVKEYTPDILNIAEHIADPDYVCLHIKVCPAARAPVLVGANPCTYGPSYWCKNEETAHECNAVKHCQMHVWE